MLRGIPCTLMRGGTSKGLYFHAQDLPADRAARDRVLLAAMGSPDPRQIDGVGGAHPLTSKVALIAASTRPDADVDYLFLQVVVDRPEVSDSQNCGNILAGIGPWAIENGLVAARDRLRRSAFTCETPRASPSRMCPPGRASRVRGGRPDRRRARHGCGHSIDFVDVSGSSCGALLPTGAIVDRVDEIEATCIDNGMPVVLLKASDFGRSGYEPPPELEADAELKARIERIRLAIGPR
jgi:4-oxalomesaconate tautomerase